MVVNLDVKKSTKEAKGNIGWNVLVEVDVVSLKLITVSITSVIAVQRLSGASDE